MIDLSPIGLKTLARLGSRGAFGLASLELGKIDEKILMLTPDLSTFSGLERFKAKYPDRTYNFGIAEQNLVGVAAGLASVGFMPFVTSYSTFISLRSADQVKVNMGYMKFPIKLIGFCSGYSLGFLGATHMALEDIALMRAIPNITIINPCDNLSVVKAVLESAKNDEPTYIRLGGSSPDPIIYKSDFDFKIGKAVELESGTDIAIIATGCVMANALKARQMLEEKGISASVIDMHTIRPLDTDAIKKACATKLIVSVEEHFIAGGLGSAISEYLSKIKANTPLLIIGAKHEYPHANSFKNLLEFSGLDADGIYNKIIEFYKEI